MPKIGFLISKIQVGDKIFNNPEVWNSAHKMKKVAKRNERLASIKADILLNSSYRVSDIMTDSYDVYIKNLQSKLDRTEFQEFAPWNSMLKKTKQIILFKKK